VPGGGSPGGGGEDPEVPQDPLDEPPAALTIFPTGPLQEGSAVVMPANPCGPGGGEPEFRWFTGDELSQGYGRKYFVIGTAEISAEGFKPLRGEYRCPGGEWVIMEPITEIEPLPPGREFQYYWQVNLEQYGFSRSVSGWYASGVVLKVVPEGDPARSWTGGISQVTRIDRINADGSTTELTRGYNGEAYVIKTRYRDNGGPWEEFLDYRQFD
jgi:hypothetical protein